jgi:hypothetical protein
MVFQDGDIVKNLLWLFNCLFIKIKNKK